MLLKLGLGGQVGQVNVEPKWGECSIYGATYIREMTERVHVSRLYMKGTQGIVLGVGGSLCFRLEIMCISR